MCQSVANPCSAEYWHMGETTTRFGRTRLRSVIGEKRALITCPEVCGNRAALCAIARPGVSLVRRSSTESDGLPGAPAGACADPGLRPPARRADGRCTRTPPHSSAGSICCTPPGPRSSPGQMSTSGRRSIRRNRRFEFDCQRRAVRARDSGTRAHRATSVPGAGVDAMNEGRADSNNSANTPPPVM